MDEVITKILLALILATGCAILSYMLKERKARILEAVTALVQKAEASVQGSGMGAEKKKLVLAQLEVMNVKLSAWLSAAIDDIVAALNERQAWFAENAKEELPGSSELK